MPANCWAWQGQWLGLPPLAKSVLVLQMGMPVAIYNYLLAQRELEYVAGLVSFTYLPVLLTIMGVSSWPANQRQHTAFR